MTLDLLAVPESAGAEPWSHPAAYWGAMTAAVADLSGPVAAVNLTALRFNALDMVVRATGVPIRVASKSVRCRALLERVLAREGFRGIMSFTLDESLWLARSGFDDVLLAYPSADHEAFADDHDAVLLALEHAAHVIEELVVAEGNLGQINQVRGVVRWSRRLASEAPAASQPVLRPMTSTSVTRSPWPSASASRESSLTVAPMNLIALP